MKAMQVTKQNFDEVIQQDRLTLIEFSAPWCVYCQRIAPAMQQVMEENADRVAFGEINIDDDPELMERWQVELVPTILLFRGGKHLETLAVPQSKDVIDALIGKYLDQQSEEANRHVYDTIILGGGPAGYTAALYAVRAGLDTLVIEKMGAGGQMTSTMQIDNYPGFEDGIDGVTLGMKMQAGAQRFGAKTMLAEVVSVKLDGAVKEVVTGKETLLARTVIIATGANHKHLGVEGETELVGRGVGYCAACDGMFYKGKTVAVVGGGNSAAADAMTLARIAKKVYIIHRRDTLRATKIYHDPLMQAQNIEFQWNSAVAELLHEDNLTGVRLRDTVTGETRDLPVDGLFVSIGRAPATALFAGQVTLDAAGYIVADETTQTNLPGVFAVGDVRTKALRQIVTAAADGAVAAHFAEEYLAGAGKPVA